MLSVWQSVSLPICHSAVSVCHFFVAHPSPLANHHFFRCFCNSSRFFPPRLPHCLPNVVHASGAQLTHLRWLRNRLWRVSRKRAPGTSPGYLFPGNEYPWHLQDTHSLEMNIPNMSGRSSARIEYPRTPRHSIPGNVYPGHVPALISWK